MTIKMITFDDIEIVFASGERRPTEMEEAGRDDKGRFWCPTWRLGWMTFEH